MEVKAGYKMSEIGVIPTDWQLKTIGEFSIVGSGGTPNRNIKSYWEGTIPWITTSQIDFNTIREADQFISEEGLNNSSAKLFKPGTLLVAMYGQGKTRGKIAMLDIKATTNQACAAISITDNTILNHYVFYNLVSRYEQIRGLSNTGNQENLNSSLIKGLLIPLPPTLTEQRAIATALSDVDRLLSAYDQLIAKKKAIKQGAMQELLTGKRRLEGFEGEWEEKKLGDVVNLNKGSINPGSFSEETFHHYSIPAFDENGEPKLEFGHEIGSQKFLVPDNAILVSKLNPRIPRVWKPELDRNGRSICSTEFLIYTPKDSVSRSFLFHLCQSPGFIYQMELGATGTTGSHQRMSPYESLKIEVEVPTNIDEQESIAQILTDMDAEIAALVQQRDKYKVVKQGMMQELLTGKTRLI